jgi:hypothetical protein
MLPIHGKQQFVMLKYPYGGDMLKIAFAGAFIFE